MKDITDYFKSSPEDVSTQKNQTENVNISMKTSEIQGEVSQSTPKSKRRLTKEKKTSVNESEGSPNTPNSKKCITKVKKTPKGMNKISPVTSPLEAYNLLFKIEHSQSTDKDISNLKMEATNIIENEESNSLESEISVGTQETSETTKANESKVNAFQFLMMGRNKVIGTNSPGKEVTHQDVAPKSKEKLLARKRLLHSWSDSIQAKKRKLNDHEVDKYIKVKLTTRKERLKSLLHIDDNSMDELEKTPKPKRKKHLLENSKKENSEGHTESKKPSNGTSKKVSKKIKMNMKDDSEKCDKLGTTSRGSGDDFEQKSVNGKEINTPKSTKTCKHKKRLKKTLELSETPKSKWKMKIKLRGHDSDDITSCIKGGEGNGSIVNESENVEDGVDVSTFTTKIDEECNVEDVVDISTLTAKIDEENDVMVAEDCESETIDCQSTNKSEFKDSIIVFEESVNTIEVAKKIENEVEIIDVCHTVMPEGDEQINGSARVLRNRASLSAKKNIDYVYSSEESDEEVNRKSNKKAVKIAPVFIKALPKPKVDPAILEARRKFLMSDMPDELRKKIEKFPSNGHNIEIDFDVFPKVSHIYQEEKHNPLWNLPDPCLGIKTTTPLNYEQCELLCESLIDKSVVKSSMYGESEPIKNIKTILMNLKLEHTSYPVYRAFRILKEKNGFQKELPPKKTTPKRKSRKSSEKKENLSTSIDQQNNLKHLMWTEKYKPRSSEDFLGNIQAVSSLKKWLERWREVLESGKRKRRRYSTDTESDFMSSDAESVYDRSLPTTVILSGPCGSGKSSAVYAVCNELGLNVLELNASSRRTGKQVIQELQEATRSHQVRKNKGGLDSFTQKGSTTNPAKDEEKNKSRRMCVLLIEDIDIVFEQDEGFISAISQISATSKRPIVLTTTNENAIYAQKFLNEFKNIRFHPLSVKSLGVWFQILCLLEGIFIDLNSIGELLEYNKGDIRKTLLELQFWTQSGGQINKKHTLLEPLFKVNSLNEDDNSTPIFDDAPSSLKELDEKLENYRIHSNILSDFETFQSLKFNNIPRTIDLSTLWWNIPKFLHPAKPRPSTPKSKKSKTRKRFKLACDMFESAAMFDVSYRKIGYKCDKPICETRWQYQLQDSLELEENFTSCSVNEDVLELNHYLTDGYLNCCKKSFIYESSENQRFLNMAVPGLEKERQLDNDHKYEEELLRPVPLLNSLDRKSVALDYLPSLRTIARTECIRAKNTVKRHNRFYNYLQTLNIVCDTPILDFATRTFSVSSCLE